MTVEQLRQVSTELQHLDALIAVIGRMPVQSPVWQTALTLFEARREILLRELGLSLAQWIFAEDEPVSATASPVVH